MKTDTYTAFEMDVTREELKVVEDFCSFLDEMLEYNDDYDIFEIIRAIAYDRQATLNSYDFKINIEGESR